MGTLASALAAARHRLGLSLTGVWVWQLSGPLLKDLDYRLQFRDPGLVREFFRETFATLRDFDEFAAFSHEDAPAPLVTFPEAQAALRASLHGASDHELRAARRTYEDAVERDLINPLLDWALSNDSSIIRNAGIDAANICRKMHAVAPLLQCDLENPTIARAYLALSKRLGCLVRDLRYWRHYKR